MATKDISIQEFEAEVLKSDLPVLVDFWAAWCPPCRMMAPVLIDISEDAELKDKLKVRKINTEEGENGYLAQLLQIQSIPNMKLFHNGKVVHSFIGFQPFPKFKAELQSVLTSLKLN